MDDPPSSIGSSSGSVIRRKRAQALARSRRAASYTSPAMLCRDSVYGWVALPLSGMPLTIASSWFTWMGAHAGFGRSVMYLPMGSVSFGIFPSSYRRRTANAVNALVRESIWNDVDAVGASPPTVAAPYPCANTVSPPACADTMTPGSCGSCFINAFTDASMHSPRSVESQRGKVSPAHESFFFAEMLMIAFL